MIFILPLFFLVLFLIFFYDKLINFKNSKCLLFFFAIVILLAYSPFFIFNDNSLIGWYDERDFIIPMHKIFLANKDNYEYVKNISGGTYIDSAFLHNFFWKIPYKFLNLFLSFKNSLLFVRFFIIFFSSALLLWLFVRLKLVTKLDNFKDIKLFGISLLFFLFSHPYFYGWTLNVFGPEMITLLLFLVISTYNLKISKNLPLLIILSLIGCTLGLNIIYFISISYIFCLIFFFTFKEKINLTFKTFILNLSYLNLILLILNIDLIFQFQNLYQETARLANSEEIDISIKFLVDETVRIFLGLFYDATTFINFSLISNNSFPFRFWTLLIILILILINKNKKHFFYFFIPIFVIFLLEHIKNLMPITMISSYRFDVAFNFFVIYYSILLFFNLKKIQNKNILNIFLISFIILTTLNIYNLINRSIHAIYIHGDWSSTSKINLNLNKDGRYVSDFYQPNQQFAINNNLEFFDGFNFDNTKTKSKLNKNFLIKKEYHNEINFNHTRHIFKSYQYDFNALKMFNVRYVFVQKENLGRLNLSNYQKKTISFDIENKFLIFLLKSFISYDFKKNRTLSLIELDNVWEKVFVPINIYYLNTSDENYYENLKNLEKHEVLIDYKYEKYLSENKKDLKIKSINYDYENINLLTNEKPGIIIINFKNFSKTRAICASNPKNKIFKIDVNTLMTGLILKSSCKNLKIIF